MSLLKRVYTNLKHTEKTEDEDCLKEIIEEGSRRIDERGGH